MSEKFRCKKMFDLCLKICFRSFITAMRKENCINFVSLLQNETFLNPLKETDGLANQMDLIQKEFHVKHNDYVLKIITNGL